MKKVYIKPVCETENVLGVKTIFAASGVHGGGTGSDLGYGGEGNPTDDPDVKADQDWDIWN